MISPELQSKMAEWRMKATANTLSLDEMREAILALRASRRSAADSKPSRTSKTPARSADDMLNDLGGI